MSFNVSLVTDEKEITSIYKLRYKVYCDEWGYDNPGRYSDRILTDEYDNDSLHFAAKDPSGKTVGAIRMILDTDAGFPIEQHCELSAKSDGSQREGLAEISRFVIHREYRKRSEDKYIYGPDEERRIIGSYYFSSGYQSQKFSARRFEDKYRNRQGGNRSNYISNIERRKRHELIISLYKALYIESKQRQISHWYAFMTKGISALLERFGFKFEAIGEPVDYYGIRTPYVGEISKIEQDMSETDPELFAEFSAAL